MPNWLRTAMMFGLASGTFAAFIIAVIWLIVTISGIDARVPTAVSTATARVMTDTPFGALGLASSFAILCLVLLSGISLLVLAIGSVLVKDNSKHRRIIGTISNCCETIASKFRQLRTTAIIFGVMLTIIILSVLHNETLIKGGDAVPDAFWIAFGVVLSAFATAIAKLVEPEDDEKSDERLAEALKPMVEEEIRRAVDASSVPREPGPARSASGRSASTRTVDEDESRA